MFYALIYLALFVKFANCDDLLNQTEIQKILRLFNNESAQNILEFIRLANQDRLDFFHYLSKIKPDELTLENKLKLLDNLVDLATCDGFLHKKEYQLLLEISKMLGFESKILIKIVENNVFKDIENVISTLNSYKTYEGLSSYYKKSVRHLHPDFLFSKNKDVEELYTKFIHEKFAKISDVYNGIRKKYA